MHEGNAEDGYVSIEVDPNLAYDTEATFEEAIRLHEWIDRPNLYVKIPATKPGLQAIEDCIADGRSINVTLLFSLERHSEVDGGVRRAGSSASSRAAATRRRCARSRASSSRASTPRRDKRLEAIGSEEALALRGKLAVANARIAYQHYKQVFSGERWEALEAKGALPQRCLWASTSTKNPEYRDVLYVEELIGPHTVNTMPEETIEAFQDHGEVRGDTVERRPRRGPHAAAEKLRRGGGRLRRRRGDAREGGRAEVLRLVQGAARRRARASARAVAA